MTYGLGQLRWLPALLLLAPATANAQTAPQASPAPQHSEHVDRELEELRSMRLDMQRSIQDMQQRMETMSWQVRDFDSRIEALETEELVPTGAHRSASAAVEAAPALDEPAMVAAQSASQEPAQSEPEWGPFEQGKGFVIARGPDGELSFGMYGYLRYLNQSDLESTYTDAFGRTRDIDRRQDFQINRLQLIFRGWLFDERFRYNMWAWTQNAAMGEESQVNIGGTMSYVFDDALTATGGIFSLPTTRSTYQSFPHWLRIDHRTMADEYFRGSYTTGIMANGEPADGLFYKVALGNNLSQLGVSASELDFRLDTLSAALWWAPTTGEFGPGFGFGDYENHTELATLFGVHFTQSRETAQGQPEADDFENTQIRLSDGTLVFSPDPFGTGGNITEATYRMLDLNAGIKYRGWSLEGEYYFRWVDDFETIGAIPVTDLYDHGFQLQASTMLAPELLQAYVSGSQIYGEFGEPWDVGIGLTLFPFRRKQMRVNGQALYMERSAVGSSPLPYVVGGDGWVFTVDVGVWF